jgi:nucleotide-binding universal stress UspA family protein
VEEANHGAETLDENGGFAKRRFFAERAVFTTARRGWYVWNAMKAIVAAVDFSNATPAVVKIATDLAHSFGADLELFHVIEPEPSYTAYGFTPDEFPAMNAFQEESRRRAALKLEELLAAVRVDLPEATSRMAEGSPLHSLLERVKEGGADFVVVGSHGHGAIAALLLGSVAEGLARKATVPTLIVPAGPE